MKKPSMEVRIRERQKKGENLGMFMMVGSHILSLLVKWRVSSSEKELDVFMDRQTDRQNRMNLIIENE